MSYMKGVIIALFVSLAIGIGTGVATYIMQSSMRPCTTYAEFGGIQAKTGSIERESVNGHFEQCRVEKYLP
jgi:hypothetical protein